MKTIAELKGIRSWGEFREWVNETPKSPEVLYGPYDAIWPTVGVECYGWFCLWCGLGDAEFPRARLSRASGESHGEACHPGLDMTYTEVHLDPEEVEEP